VKLWIVIHARRDYAFGALHVGPPTVEKSSWGDRAYFERSGAAIPICWDSLLFLGELLGFEFPEPHPEYPRLIELELSGGKAEWVGEWFAVVE